MDRHWQGNFEGATWRLELRRRWRSLDYRLRLWWDARLLWEGSWPFYLPYFTLLRPVTDAAGRSRCLELRLSRHAKHFHPAVALFLDRRLIAGETHDATHPGPYATRTIVQRGLGRLFAFRYLPYSFVAVVLPGSMSAWSAKATAFYLGLGVVSAAIQSGRAWLAAFLDQGQRRCFQAGSPS